MSRFFHSRTAEFMLVPPLAVIVYLIFSQPKARFVQFRSIVVMPVIGAVFGAVAYRFLGLTPLGVAAALFAVLLVQDLLRAYMPPALAIAVLAMLLRVSGPYYAAGVAVATMLVVLIFVLWRKFLWSRFPEFDA